VPTVPCVGALVHDDAGRLLLVRRRNEPGAGLWSVPGGRVERDEDDAAAVVREVAEETGLVVDVGDMVGEVLRHGPGGVTYAIRDYRCTVREGRLVAADDATDAGWVSAADLRSLPLVPQLREALEEWGMLPRH
jgi:8-oxo-dGTP diphosphatase